MQRCDDIANPADQFLVCQEQRESPESKFPTNSQSAESPLESAVEWSVNRAIFGSELGRREFVRLAGAGAAAAIVNSIFPLAAAKALAQEKTGPIEKKQLKVGFIPITCATPIIMAEPMGFYKKYGLDVQVHKASGWAMIRDLSINGETDATHMLTPMPLAFTMGVGSQAVPFWP
jgi:nitrate/nitrite transport system substrate-binding protein